MTSGDWEPGSGSAEPHSNSDWLHVGRPTAAGMGFQDSTRMNPPVKSPIRCLGSAPVSAGLFHETRLASGGGEWKLWRDGEWHEHAGKVRARCTFQRCAASIEWKPGSTAATCQDHIPEAAGYQLNTKVSLQVFFFHRSKTIWDTFKASLWLLAPEWKTFFFPPQKQKEKSFSKLERDVFRT